MMKIFNGDIPSTPYDKIPLIGMSENQYIKYGFDKGQQSILNQCVDIKEICIHCGNEARCIIKASEYVPLCLECAGKFISKGLPRIEKYIAKKPIDDELRRYAKVLLIESATWKTAFRLNWNWIIKKESKDGQPL